MATWVFGRNGTDLAGMFGLHFFMASDFHVYQLVTYMFIHANLEHLFFNMFALWMFGCVVENSLGSKRFTAYYLICGTGAGLIQMITQFGSFYLMAADQIPGFGVGDIFTVARNSAPLLNQWTTVGASGAIYGILLAFGMLYPGERIFIFPLPIPIKAKWFVCIYIAVELFAALGTSNDSVAHFAHLGGMLFGWIMIRYWNKNTGYGNFGYNNGFRFFDNIKDYRERRTNKKTGNKKRDTDTRTESDWEYNTRKKSEENEMDRILDKVRRSGYDSLTDDEKRKLFNGGK